MMLKKYLIYPLFGLLISTSFAMAELKIGFVNIALVMAQSPQAEKAEKDMEREFSPRKNRLDASGTEIERMKDKLNRDGAVMSESERKNLENDILKKLRDAKRTEDDLREDLNIRRNEILVNLNKQMTEAINELAKEGGYDLVLTSGVGYVSEAVDVTEELQAKLKQKF
ncbi:MAG: OmpH family outer membrane protein [Methylococcaceae bacterium]|nr:OmpH family outer membrane protein [Methylococcaceae bacterium]